MSWTDERVEILKRMWAEGKSASQIAKELGGVTRNAVIGKVHRLGLSSRTTTSRNDTARSTKAEATSTTDQHVERDEPKQSSQIKNTPTPASKSPASASALEEKLAKLAEKTISSPPPHMLNESTPTMPPAGATPQKNISTRPANQDTSANQIVPLTRAESEIQPEVLASAREVEKASRRLSLMELTERTCKWPIGDPATTEFWFCGTPSQAGKPYCEAHVSVAFQPMSNRRDRRR